MQKGDIVYYARCLRESGIYEVCELKIRTINENWFVGTDSRSKQAFYFDIDKLNKTVFYDRKVALKKVKNAEKNKIIFSEEKYYEEY